MKRGNKHKQMRSKKIIVLNVMSKMKKLLSCESLKYFIA
jgi:hypothetical protein